MDKINFYLDKLVYGLENRNEFSILSAICPILDLIGHTSWQKKDLIGQCEECCSDGFSGGTLSFMITKYVDEIIYTYMDVEFFSGFVLISFSSDDDEVKGRINNHELFKVKKGFERNKMAPLVEDKASYYKQPLAEDSTYTKLLAKACDLEKEFLGKSMLEIKKYIDGCSLKNRKYFEVCKGLAASRVFARKFKKHLEELVALLDGKYVDFDVDPIKNVSNVTDKIDAIELDIGRIPFLLSAMLDLVGEVYLSGDLKLSDIFFEDSQDFILGVNFFANTCFDHSFFSLHESKWVLPDVVAHAGSNPRFSSVCVPAFSVDATLSGGTSLSDYLVESLEWGGLPGLIEYQQDDAVSDILKIIRKYNEEHGFC